MSTIRANGIDQAYEAVGAGPPLVMLHGAGSGGQRDFAAQLPSYRTAFRCYLPDSRGHGRTRWDAGDDFSLEMLVDDVAAFVDGLELASFHLVGFSMGAMTALRFAARQPERLRTLVVIGISTEREPRAAIARRLMDPDRIESEDPALAADLALRIDAHQGRGAWRRLLPAIAADVAVQPLLTARELHAIDAPTLVACGDRDPFCPVEHARAIARQVADGRLLVVPDCGHEVPSQRPGLFNEACRLFYRTTEPIARSRAGSAEGDSP